MNPVVQGLAAACSNWGKWGPEDERGTLNYITAEKRQRAAALVRRGAVFSLSIPFDADGPQRGRGGRVNPIHLMSMDGADEDPRYELAGGARYTDDFIAMPLQCATQWDSLAHVYYDAQLYNGYPARTVDSRGAGRNGIDKVHDGFVSRGVLLDVARAKGEDTLPPGYAITVEDLEAAEQRAGVRVDEGDIMLVRTGMMSTRAAFGDWRQFHEPQPGLHYETLPWLHGRRVAAVACDNTAVEASDALPGVRLPFHMVAIRDMGLSLGELWDMEALAADCAADHVCAFLLVAAALPFTGAVGSPVNPIAMK
jgi:kynurenine formamidase